MVFDADHGVILFLLVNYGFKGRNLSEIDKRTNRYASKLVSSTFSVFSTGFCAIMFTYSRLIRIGFRLFAAIESSPSNHLDPRQTPYLLCDPPIASCETDIQHLQFFYMPPEYYLR